MKTVFIVFEDGIFIEVFSTSNKAKDYVRDQKESRSVAHYHIEEKEIK
ncbi:hypothetical protein [Anaerobacillus arseniciselenatis]|nr:hypothetical protein [Anaerobacillus arseniciselenatis]